MPTDNRSTPGGQARAAVATSTNNSSSREETIYSNIELINGGRVSRKVIPDPGPVLVQLVGEPSQLPGFELTAVVGAALGVVEPKRVNRG